MNVYTIVHNPYKNHWWNHFGRTLPTQRLTHNHNVDSANNLHRIVVRWNTHTLTQKPYARQTSPRILFSHRQRHVLPKKHTRAQSISPPTEWFQRIRIAPYLLDRFALRCTSQHSVGNKTSLLATQKRIVNRHKPFFPVKRMRSTHIYNCMVISYLVRLVSVVCCLVSCVSSSSSLSRMDIYLYIHVDNSSHRLTRPWPIAEPKKCWPSCASASSVKACAVAAAQRRFRRHRNPSTNADVVKHGRLHDSTRVPDTRTEERYTQLRAHLQLVW